MKKELRVPAVAPFEDLAAAAQEPTGRIITNQLSNTYQKSTQNDPGGWLHSAARLQMFSRADEDLTRASELRGRVVKRVRKVRVAMVEGSKIVWVYPTEDEDVDGIPVRRYKSSVWVNLVTLLGPAKLTVRPGSRELYPLQLVENSPVGPALEMDLSRMVERRNKKDSEKAAAEGSGEKKTNTA